MDPRAPAPRPWNPERVVTPDRAARLLERRFPDLAPACVEPFGDGWDNTAYLVNGDLVFRFPRREIAVPFMRTECRVLPEIAPRLPVVVPVPTHEGEPGDDWPWPFAGYRRVPGTTLCRSGALRGDRRALAADLGRFLAALHSIRASEARALGAPGDTLGRLDLAKRIPMAREHLARARAAGLVADVAPLAEIVDGATSLSSGVETCLVHGDLYALHLLVDADGRLCGVIDWGDVHAGDPAADLMAAHLVLPPEDHGAFRDAYGEIGELTWRLARFRALLHASIVAVYGHEIADADLERAGVEALGYLAERED